MCGLVGRQPLADESAGILPEQTDWGVSVMSIGFFLPDAQTALIWRGPMKMNAIKQFLRDVQWGPLDYLVVDCPPGTGDEPLSIAQLLGSPCGALVVTTPQRVAVDAVRRSITFCRRLELDLLGVVENMSGFLCPHCGKQTPLFSTGGGEQMAAEAGLSLLARIPFRLSIGAAGDAGQPVALNPDSPDSRAYAQLARTLIDHFEPQAEGEQVST
jgi:Mrp family chromosome partitioning ATPase